MTEGLKIIFSLSCSGALLILLFCLFHPLLRSRLSKRWQYYIWLVVVFRLLLPFAPEINLMGILFQEATQSGYALMSSQDRDSVPVSPNNYNGAAERNFQKEPSYTADETNDLHDKGASSANSYSVWWFWLAVALILVIRKITIYQSFVKYIKAGCVEVENIDLLEQFGEIVEQNKVKRTVELYTNNLISSPLLIGFFCPCIVLPSDKLPDPEFQYTILHELTHYKRGDMFYKWLIQLTVCIHWFNPLVYFMSSEVARLCELSCDEAIIKDLDMQRRRAYGDTLLNAAGGGGTYKNSIASVTLGESKNRLKERLDAIKAFQRKSRYVRFFSIALTIAVCFVAAAMGAYAANPLSAREAEMAAKPHKIGALTLIQEEYTVEELKTLDILVVVIDTLSDDVSVVKGGDTLKFEYYALTQDEYSFKPMQIFADTPRRIVLKRSRPSEVRDERLVTITIPEKLKLESLHITTTSGSISITDCMAKSILTQTQNGQIDIVGGAASELLMVNTETGDTFVSGTALPDSGKNSQHNSVFNTGSGTVVFRPFDSADNYCFDIEYGEEAEVYINNEGIEAIEMPDSSGTEGSDRPTHNTDGAVTGEKAEFIKKSAFTINEDASRKVKFYSPRGTLIVQEE